MSSLKEWLDQAARGTSGDMVFDILHDWDKDRQQLIEMQNLASQFSGRDNDCPICGPGEFRHAHSCPMSRR